MRWENLTAIGVAMAIAQAMNLVSGARFDDPMTSLLESIRADGWAVHATPEARIWPAGLARL